jgi:hypothetical protein
MREALINKYRLDKTHMSNLWAEGSEEDSEEAEEKE